MAVTIVRLIKMIIINYNKSLNTGLKESLNKKHLDKIFLWCFVWAIGSTLSTESMEAFEKIVAETFPVDSLPRGSALDYLLRID
jgi:dynein heavy chain